MGKTAIARILTPIRGFVATLWTESLEPGRAAAAVFTGVFIGNVPIYGFQSLAAVGLAVFFRLNKPLTLGATFINNPLFQPFLVAGSVELGYFLQTGHWQSFTRLGLKNGFLAWVIGSITLGVILGGIGALVTFFVLRLREAGGRIGRERARFVNQLFARCLWRDRGFVRWKLRLDRIFEVLAAEDPGSGVAVDLGCGHGIALAFAAFRERGRRLVGCDLNAARMAAARQALAGMNAVLSVEDVRRFELPRAGLILILDVLQYLGAEEQLVLVARCCAALEPGGKFIFRVHDRERGVLSRLSLGFDRMIFFFGRAGSRPLMLSAAEYRGVLERAGVEIAEHRLRNRLPLAHRVYVATRPAEARP